MWLYVIVVIGDVELSHPDRMLDAPLELWTASKGCDCGFESIADVECSLISFLSWFTKWMSIYLFRCNTTARRNDGNISNGRRDRRDPDLVIFHNIFLLWMILVCSHLTVNHMIMWSLLTSFSCALVYLAEYSLYSAYGYSFRSPRTLGQAVILSDTQRVWEATIRTTWPKGFSSHIVIDNGRVQDTRRQRERVQLGFLCFYMNDGRPQPNIQHIQHVYLFVCTFF